VADFSYYIDLSEVKFAEGQTSSWLHAMPLGKVQHPIYGEMDFGESALTAYANSVIGRTLGNVDPVIDYDHQEYSGKAAGWVKSAKVQTDAAAGNGLQLFVEWTDEAVKQIKAKEYRYFSPTFREVWEDQDGKKHNNVLFGGGITNRPYLKNLVPVNLSDLSFKNPANPSPTEDDMDMKKLREMLGLPETTSDDDTWKAFADNWAKLQVPADPPKIDPPKVDPPAPTFQLSEELRALAAANPVVDGMIKAFENQIRQSADQEKQLREQAIAVKLSALDRSNLVVAPSTKDLAHDIAMELNEAVAEKFWKLMDNLITSQAFVIEMGERSRSGSSYNRDKSAKQLFEEYTNALVAGGMQYADAVSQVSATHPGLYDRYRDETFITRV